MTADRDDDSPIPPPGMVPISMTFDGFNLSARGVIRSPGHPDKAIIVAIRPDVDHLDGMVADLNGQPVRGVEAIAGMVERWVADTVGLLVDWSTDPSFHVHLVQPDEPDPVDIKPMSQPAKAVH